MGAAPVMAKSTWSRPTSSLTGPNAAAWRKSHVASCSAVALPHDRSRAMGIAAAMPSSNWAFLAGSAPRAALTPAWIFSHTRGTPNMMLGRTSLR